MAKRRRRKRPGKKHKILFVTHSMSRIYRSLLLASIVVWSMWWVAPYTGSIFMPPNDQFLQLIGFGLIGLMLAAFFLRNRGYIQARDGYVRLQGIFFRIRIPYSRVENVRMAVFREVYRGVKLSWASRRFFKKHYKETVATLILNRYPIPLFLLRFFLPNYLFLPRGTGFLVLVKDYVGFNTEVDSRLNSWRDEQRSANKMDQGGADEYDGYYNTFDD